MSACKLLLAEYTRHWEVLRKGYYALSQTWVLMQLGSLLFNLKARSVWTVLLELVVFSILCCTVSRNNFTVLLYEPLEP